MESREATMYRACVARGIYLSQDRSDIMVAVKEVSRKTASPNQGDLKALKRLARYLVDKARAVIRYGC